MTSSSLSQKEYLKRYLSGGKDDKKKRKNKKKIPQDSRLKIVDDDTFNPSSIQELDAADLQLYDLAENAPQIAGFVDERPPELQALDTFQNSSKWKIIANEYEDVKIEAVPNARDGNDDDDCDPIFQNKPIKQEPLGDDFSPSQSSKSKKNRRTRSNDSGSESDLSPPRDQPTKNSKHSRSRHHNSPDKDRSRSHNKKIRRRSSDSDLSPPRQEVSSKKKHMKSRGSDSDLSPPRQKHKKSKDQRGSDSDLSPPRRSDTKRHSARRNEGSDSDLSPPRKGSSSRQKKSKDQRGSDSDLSPPRRSDTKRHSSRRNEGSDSDLSPPRKGSSSRQKKSIDQRGSDSDLSPPRHSGANKRNKSHNSFRQNNNSDSDLSPPRGGKSSKTKTEQSKRYRPSPVRQQGFTGDRNAQRSHHRSVGVSPPRRDNSSGRSKQQLGGHHHANSPRRDLIQGSRQVRHNTSDSDLSPPRPGNSRKQSAPRMTKIKKEIDEDDHSRKRSPDLSPSRSKKRAKSNTETQEKLTLDGKKAGLQDAKTLKVDTERMRAVEDAHFQQMSDQVSGRGAQTVVRDRKTGRKRDVAKEEEERRQEEQRKQEKLERFKELNKGLVQLKAKETLIQDMLHESAKPLARYADDQDLEAMLKNQERDGDPMLEYLREKRQLETPESVKPRYRGPAPPPNRYNIWPGHKWDGVDRSTGFEKKVFEQKNAKKALEEEAYKWSVSDM